MIVSTEFHSPNFSTQTIPVEFIILHYTAANLKHTLEIFADPARGVCAHFVLDIDGTVYDLGNFLNGPILQGAHAGISRLELQNGQTLTALNLNSIGIEIVNLNGNLCDYSEAQYISLIELLRWLTSRFPITKQASRILGHEQIAGFRGKCDPGIKFSWERVLGAINLKTLPIHKHTVFTEQDAAFAREFARTHDENAPAYWSELSSALETQIAARLKV